MEKLKILIVDDKPANLEVLERILEPVNVDFIRALSGNEAVFKAMENDFALMLIDVQMPGMDGFETAEYIRKEKKNENTPIIFISASQENDYNKVKGIESGGIDFISKPIIEEVLIGKVNIFLQIFKDKECLKELAEETKIASAAKSQFLANMSHEIRTPMNAILGFSEILKSKTSEPQLLYYIDLILSSGKSLLNLINDILDLSKVEAGKMELDYTAISPQNLFNEIEIIFGQKIKEKGLELIIDIPSELPKALLLDETRLRQILINLIGNAIKFTESGHIKLSANFRYPNDIEHSSLDFIFSVEDTGKGIPKDQLDFIFNAFSQVKGQKSSEFGGTGLGLAITSRLIEMMNGSINVESKIGKGTVFNIILKDIAVASTKSLKSYQEQEVFWDSLEFEKSTILMADDIEFNRVLIKEMLNEYNFEYFDAENGKIAIEKAKKHHPDLILMDMRMPVMNGYDAVSILKKNNDLKKIPVIAVTASAMKEEKEKIKSLCESYIIKPISKTNLVSEIMKFLPYKKNKETAIMETEEVSVKFSLESFTGYPELHKILKNKSNDIKKLLKNMSINDIIEFADELKEHGEKYNHQSLINLCKNLAFSAKNFDIEKVKKLINNLLVIMNKQ